MVRLLPGQQYADEVAPPAARRRPIVIRTLRRPDIDHILRAAASLSGHSRFVMVGTGAVIATAKHIPVVMMMTEEIDIYVEDVAILTGCPT